MHFTDYKSKHVLVENVGRTEKFNINSTWNNHYYYLGIFFLSFFYLSYWKKRLVLPFLKTKLIFSGSLYYSFNPQRQAYGKHLMNDWMDTEMIWVMNKWIDTWMQFIRGKTMHSNSVLNDRNLSVQRMKR